MSIGMLAKEERVETDVTGHAFFLPCEGTLGIADWVLLTLGGIPAVSGALLVLCSVHRCTE